MPITMARKFRASLWAPIIIAITGAAGAASAQERAGLIPAPQVHSEESTRTFAKVDDPVVAPGLGDYQIGPEDLLEVSVLEAPELSRTVRVSDDGEISLPLLGSIQAAGLSTKEMQSVLEDLLRRTYMKDPQVSVFVQEMRSHPVSVFGAVEKPGVYQIRDAKPLIEVLSMAQGLTDDAGDSVIIVRRRAQSDDRVHAALLNSETTDRGSSLSGLASADSGRAGQPEGDTSDTESITIKLKDLLNSSHPSSDVLVYPGDTVKVTRAGIVYVVGEVHKPGGFLLKTNENISVLQAIALAEGTTSTSNRKQARIILADESNGSRKDVSINLDRILAGKAPDPVLGANDILFIPNSSSKAALHSFAQSSAMVVASVGGAAVYRW